MKSRNLVICDSEAEYASRLAKYLEGKKELALQVTICESPEQVEKVRREAGVDILMADERLSFPEEDVRKIPQVVWLADMGASREDSAKRRIFRYQKRSEIYTELVEELAVSGPAERWGIHKKERGKLIGVYSPVRRLGQTSFCIGKGMELAKSGNVLYMNLEDYAGFGGYFPEEKEKNLSMLLYYARQELGSPGLLVTTIVKQMGELDYIPPALFPEDIRGVRKEEWLWLFEEILMRSIYDVLILDLGDMVQGLFEILKSCDVVYLPVADDRIAASKLCQFEEILCRQGYGEVWERMIRCDIRRTVEGKDTREDGSVPGDRG